MSKYGNIERDKVCNLMAWVKTKREIKGQLLTVTVTHSRYSLGLQLPQPGI